MGMKSLRIAHRCCCNITREICTRQNLPSTLSVSLRSIRFGHSDTTGIYARDDARIAECARVFAGRLHRAAFTRSPAIAITSARVMKIAHSVAGRSAIRR